MPGRLHGVPHAEHFHQPAHARDAGGRLGLLKLLDTPAHQRVADLFHRQDLRSMRGKIGAVVFDEMETFEHSKCKPLSIAVAVEEGSRRIIGARVSIMPAKGRLAEISRKKYGRRPDRRKKGLKELLSSVGQVRKPVMIVKSDRCPRYPSAVRTHLPGATHITFKSRRACVVGQGELKSGGFDPLFSLNHTCAMVRDNLKRLSRRTWCTTKRPDRLQCLINLYICAPNTSLDRKTEKREAPPGVA